MIFNIHSIILLTVILTNLLALFFGLKLQRQNKGRLFFSLLMVGTIIWNLSSFANFTIITDPNLGEVVAKLINACVMFVPYLAFCLYISFMREKSLGIRLLNGLFLISRIVFLGFIFGTDLIIAGVEQRFSINNFSVPGKYYSAFGAAFIFEMLMIYIGLFFSRHSYEKQDWEKVQYFIFAFFVSVLVGSLAFVTTYYDFVLPEIGSVGTSLYAGIIVYAVTKKQLLDVRVVIGKTAAVITALVGNLILVSLVFEGFQSNPSILFFIIVIITSISMMYGQVLYEKIITTSKRLAIKGYYNTQEAIKKISDALTPLTKQEDILTTLADQLDDILEIEHVWVLLNKEGLDGKTRSYKFHNSKSELTIPKDHPVIAYATGNNKITQPAELEPAMKDQFSALKLPNLKLTIPINSPDALEGIIFLGEKSKGTGYSQKDIDFLQTTLAMIMSLLYRLTPQEKIEAKFMANQQKLFEAEKQQLHIRLNQAQLEINQNVHHELRNPIAAILGNAKKIPEDDELLAKVKEKIVRNAKRIHYVVDNSLNLVQSVPLGEDTVNLNAIIEQCLFLEDLSGYTVEKSYGDIPDCRGSEWDLVTVFTNLLKNAIKATPDGGTIRIQTDTLNDDVVTIIADTGVGIAPENLDKVWNLHFTTDKTHGQGLGLNIVQNIIHNHNGIISVDSAVGKGASFTIRLPGVG